MRVCNDLSGAKAAWFTGRTIAALSSRPFPVTEMPVAVMPDWPDSSACTSGPSEAEPKGLHVVDVDPIYLFYCSVGWHRQADAGAGWELIYGLRASGPEVRSVASALLAQAADVRLPVPDLRSGNYGIEKTAAANSRKADWPVIDKVVTMNTPYGLEIIESCVTCKLRRDKWFCSLSPEVLKSFSGASHLSTYPGGAVLFVEGQMPRGAFVLCSGKVKLSTTSREGKVLILKMAGPGEALGLSAVISGTC
jgi:hypothetical protein